MFIKFFIICCCSYFVSSFADENINEVYKEKIKLLPKYKFCGFQHTDDRIYNETETALDEFPWLVNIRFTNLETDFNFVDRCSGVLISNRYVLTSAFCGAEAKKVRMGEHNTNQTVSCVEESDLKECNDPVNEVKVEEIIRDGKTQNGPYDFTLLRLASKTTFSEYIRPICLNLDGNLRPQKLETLIFSGWGSSDASGITKKRFTYNITDNKVCYEELDWLQGNIEFAEATLICVAPQENNIISACSGEHGGPFMYSFSRLHQWYVDGIIIYASPDGQPDSCSRNKSINGIKITPKTIRWILESIRP